MHNYPCFTEIEKKVSEELTDIPGAEFKPKATSEFRFTLFPSCEANALSLYIHVYVLHNFSGNK